MPEETPKKPKKPKRTGYVCGACRWHIDVDSDTGRCRRYPPNSPGESPGDPNRYLPIELDGMGCGEWKPPSGQR